MDVNLYSYDNFLSECFNRQVYSLNKIPKDYFIEDKDADFIYCRTPSIDLHNHATLIREGFNLIGVNVKLKYKFKNQINNYATENIRMACKLDKVEVKILAQNSFVYDRFHKDDEIPSNMASELKKKWVANYFIGRRGDNLLVAEINNKIAGFILLIEKEKEIIIDLIAVGKSFRQLGIGKSLIKESFNIYKNKEKDFIVVTQITNLESLNLYQKTGFTIDDTNFVWHWHKK